MSKLCKTCKAFSVEFGQRGQCRRHAPILILELSNTDPQWPTIFAEQWCCDYIEQEQLDEKEVCG